MKWSSPPAAHIYLGIARKTTVQTPTSLRLIPAHAWTGCALWFLLTFVVGCEGRSPKLPPPEIAVPSRPAFSTVIESIPVAVLGARYREESAQRGLSFEYRNGQEVGHAAILESLGGGAGVLDYDGDGVEDLLFAGGGGFGPERQIAGRPAALFRSLEPGRFERVADLCGVGGDRYYSHGVAVRDFDADGFADALLTGYGGLQLFKNQGDGTFLEGAGTAGLDDRLWSTSAGWGDLNGDGALDLYVAHYVNWSFDNHPYCEGPRPEQREVCPPRRYAPLPDTLYLSNGDGTFRDASQKWGLRLDGKGLGVLLADLDLDGDLDIYVANDTVENFLYENVDKQGLRDVSLSSGASMNERGIPDGSMGVDLFDYNQDGLPDLWVANYERESCALYENSGHLLFRHVSQPVGVTAVGGLFVGWGTHCFDVDRDGDEDMYVANGHVIRYPTNAPDRQTPLLFENQGNLRFRNVAAEAGDYTASPHMARGVASADFDSDGDVDLAISNVNEPVALLINETPSDGNWLEVDLIGRQSPRDAVGALVTVKTNERELRRHWRGGGSYASTNSRRLHFGLGSATTIEGVEIRWPSGIRQIVTAPAARQVLRVLEAEDSR